MFNNKEEKRLKIDFSNKSISAALVGQLLKNGEKSKACKTYFQILKNLKINYNDKIPVGLIMECLHNIMPSLKLKSKKVGGTVYQIPIPLTKRKEYSIGIKWLIESSNNKNISIIEAMSKDIIESIKNEGELIKRKESDYKLALANRPFLKFLK